MTGNRFHKWTATTWGVVVLAGSASAAVFDNFETSGPTGTLATNYNQQQTTDPFINTNTAPTIGNGSIKANANNTLTYKADTFSLKVGQSITTSIKVNQRPASLPSQVLVQLGFGDKNNDVFNNGNGYVSIFSRLVSEDTAQPTKYKLLSDNKADPAQPAAEVAPATGIALAGTFAQPTWYLYSMTLTRTDATTFTSSGLLQAIGNDGAAAPTDVTSFGPITYTNAALATVAENGLLYAGIRSNTASGELRLDDFRVSDPVAVPEPAAAGALGLAALATGRRRRTR